MIQYNTGPLYIFQHSFTYSRNILHVYLKIKIVYMKKLYVVDIDLKFNVVSYVVG